MRKERSFADARLGRTRAEERTLGLGEPSVADNLPGWARSVGATATLFYCVLKRRRAD